MNSDCTIYKTMNFVGKKWTLVIMLELYKAPVYAQRYSELKASLADVTPKILSLRLKELESEGLIDKTIDASKFPIKCVYSLTPSGKDFVKILKQIKDWSLEWKYNSKACESSECRNCMVSKK